MSGMQVVAVLAGLVAAACCGVSAQAVDELRVLVPMYARPDGELRAFWCHLRRAGELNVSRESGFCVVACMATGVQKELHRRDPVRFAGNCLFSSKQTGIDMGYLRGGFNVSVLVVRLVNLSAGCRCLGRSCWQKAPP